MELQYIEDLLHAVLSLRGPVVYSLAFGFALVETALFLGFVIPGELGLVFTAIVANQNDLSLPLLIAIAIVGATIGDSISYTLGRRYGMRLVSRAGPLKRYLVPRMERASAHFEERGGLAVVVGRFVVAMRAVAPAVAGMGGMPFPRFLVWNVAASIAWASTVITLGWVFSRPIVAIVEDASLWLAIAVVGVFAAYEVGSWLRHHPERRKQLRHWLASRFRRRR